MGDAGYLIIGILIAVPFWALILYLKNKEDKRKFDKYSKEREND